MPVPSALVNCSNGWVWGSGLQHYPGMLSGGEQQRVAIARSLARRPALLLADEPTGNLDPATGRDVFGLLRELQQELGFALILATHSERLARACERLLRLDGGRLHKLDELQTAAYFEGLGAGGGLGPYAIAVIGSSRADSEVG